MAVLEHTFQVGAETVHAVVLRQTSKHRWNAYLWGAGLRFANTFARRESAEKWLAHQLHHYFPTLPFEMPRLTLRPPAATRKPRRQIMREPVYRGA